MPICLLVGEDNVYAIRRVVDPSKPTMPDPAGCSGQIRRDLSPAL